MWISFVIRLFTSYGKQIAIGIASVFLITQVTGFVRNWLDGREDRSILECNETQLRDEITVLENLLEQERKDSQEKSQELERMASEAERRQLYIDNLEDVLNDSGIPDDRISERTREFWRQLNEEAKRIQK